MKLGSLELLEAYRDRVFDEVNENNITERYSNVQQYNLEE
jgi:hypothetical protein